MNILSQLLFNLRYYQRPPWDTGISPPELLNLLQTLPPGRALDLGCGTGTNALTLASLGWQVTGVDFAPRAIHLARQKAQQVGALIHFHVADVTRLRLPGPYDFALDLGCLHSLSTRGKVEYVTHLAEILRPGATWLLYAFLRPNAERSAPGLDEADLKRIQSQFTLTRRQDGLERGQRPSAYFTFQRKQ